ncbi:MAG: DUF4112 domain-containing protein [Bacteroides sp.]|nr:DUF4112 domain-containing protein [Bacteroides sp.]
MGKVIKEVDISDYMKSVEEVRKYQEEEANQAEALGESGAFSLVYAAKKYDDWFLDPLVGFIVPGVGDILSSIATMPAIYVAIFKLQSFKLTLAIICTLMVDLLCGLIPVAGDLVDCFYKSNKIACRLVVGYVQKDPAIMEEINRRAKWGIIGLLVLGVLIYAAYSLIVSIIHWLGSLM